MVNHAVDIWDPDGAGHYVKMVHNGIEYGDIQLVCEVYAILKDILGRHGGATCTHFRRMEQALEVYLIEITSQIFQKIYLETSGWLT